MQRLQRAAEQRAGVDGRQALWKREALQGGAQVKSLFIQLLYGGGQGDGGELQAPGEGALRHPREALAQLRCGQSGTL